MNGTPPAEERKILIGAPLSGAFELTREILFRPFDFTKWLVLGFAAFLAGLADGTRSGTGFNFPSGSDFKGRGFSTSGEEVNVDWTIVGPILAVVAIIFIVVTVVCFWAGSRGRFIFIDCIVRNRAAIAEPWREFSREGNSLFFLMIVVTLIFFAIAAVLATPFWLPFARGQGFTFTPALLLYGLIGFAIFMVVGVVWALLFWFVPVVMYRQRCTPVAALRQIGNLVVEYPVPFILFLLVAIGLWTGGAIFSCLVTCFTCCLAALPYVGSVILLPLYVFYYSFTLLFLRQFGPEFDAWGKVIPLEPSTPEGETPPLDQTPPDEPPPLPPRTI
jgi:hypothetical protein